MLQENRNGILLTNFVDLSFISGEPLPPIVEENCVSNWTYQHRSKSTSS